MSDRAIADHVGVDHKTVSIVRRESTGEFPQSATSIDKNGRVINTANIGRKSERSESSGGPDIDTFPPSSIFDQEPPRVSLEMVPGKLTGYTTLTDWKAMRGLALAPSVPIGGDVNGGSIQPAVGSRSHR